MSQIIIASQADVLHVRDIIDAAFRILRGAKSPEPITALDRENGLLALKFMARSWQAENLGLWLDDDVEMTLCACQVEYRTERYIKVRNIRRRLADNTEIMIGNNGWPMSRAEFSQIPSRATATGRPVQAFYWMSPTYGTLAVWPAPVDAAESLVFTARLPFRDFTLDAVVDFPPEWLDALRFNLAVRLADEYPGDNATQATMPRAAELKEALFAYDTDPGPTYFQPDFY